MRIETYINKAMSAPSIPIVLDVALVRVLVREGVGEFVASLGDGKALERMSRGGGWECSIYIELLAPREAIELRLRYGAGATGERLDCEAVAERAVASIETATSEDCRATLLLLDKLIREQRGLRPPRRGSVVRGRATKLYVELYYFVYPL